MIQRQYPEARLVLANARGNYTVEIRRLLGTLPEGRYTEIPFEDDMPALYRTFDAFVHAPILPTLEAFGQVYIEAMAAAVPCVCTIAGIASEVLVHGENAVVVEACNPEQIANGVLKILRDPMFCAQITANAIRDVQSRFAIKTMIKSLEKLYFRELEATGGKKP
jgi:glycosyltransferase involved in cell wall biosynthesis